MRKMWSCAEELERYGFVYRFRRTHDHRLIELECVGDDGIFAGGENIDATVVEPDFKAASA